MAGSSKNPNVGPRIEIMLGRQQKNVCGVTTPPELSAIGIPFPSDAAKQSAIRGTKGDEIAAPAMIGTEDEFSVLQLREGMFDVARAQARAIASDGNDFVVSEVRDRLDGVLEPRPECFADLTVDRGASRFRGMA